METEKATGREPLRGPRLPWISTVEPTVFWGLVCLTWAAGLLACAVVVAAAALEGVAVLRAIEAVLRGR